MFNLARRNKYTYYIILIIFLAYFFRLFFGLNFEFWFVDNVQIYLIGLKYYTTGLWPYWGPDVVHTQSSIPGALQGLLVGLPFYIVAIPEAPTIFLNIVTLFSFSFFGWYLSRRIPSIPLHIILIWLLTIPSAMYYSTTVQNPSYVIIGAVFFFISVFEIFPFYPQKIIPPKTLFFLLSFSLLWIYQLHMSWVLLLPYIVLCFYFKYKESKQITFLAIPFLYFIMGATICFSTLLPTLIQFNEASSQALKENISLNFSNITKVFDIIFKFLSFSTFDVESFIPYKSIKDPRVTWFLSNYFWVIPLAVFLFITRVAQFIYLVYSFLSNRKYPNWNKVQVFLIFTICLIWFSFLFADHLPNSYKFYLVMPISIWYSLQVYQYFYNTKKGKIFSHVFLLSGIIFYFFVILLNNKLDMSLYSNKAIIEKAIMEKDYTYVGIRRISAESMLQNKKIWKESVLIDSLIYETNLEYDNEYDLPQNISSKLSYSGKYSCKIDSIQPFSIAFEKILKPDTVFEKVNISLWMYSKYETDALIVISLDDKDKNIYYNSLPITYNPLELPQWHHISGSINLPTKIISTLQSNLKIYVWYPKKINKVIYIDNIKIVFIKKILQKA